MLRPFEPGGRAVELCTVTWDPSTGWSRPLPDWDGPSTLVMLYGGSGLVEDPSPIQHVVAAYPTAVLVGCSTAGEIVADAVFDDTLTLTVARFEAARISLVQHLVTDPSESYEAGLALAGRLRSQEPELRAVFVLSDGLGVNGSPLVAGLVAGCGEDVAISGGLAGDGERFERTWVLVDGEPRSGYVTAVGLAGPRLRVGHGSRGGWDIFGPERRVTRSAGKSSSNWTGSRRWRCTSGISAIGSPACRRPRCCSRSRSGYRAPTTASWYGPFSDWTNRRRA